MNPADLRLYIAPRAPNPRRVQMFIAEKGITGIPEVAVDLNAQEHRSDAFRARSPLAKVPALELPDGRVLTEPRAPANIGAGQVHFALVPEELARVVAAGGEGLMLHRRDAHYRPGRSDHLLKYKTHQDAEAQVVAHLPGKGKYEGMMGAVQVRTPEGRSFRLGSGFTDAQRAAPPPLGAWVTYRYSGLTSTGLPRFARFVRVREDLPPPDRAR